MIGRFIEDVIITLFYFLFSGLVWLVYEMGNVITKIFDVLETVFSSSIFKVIYINISIIVITLLFTTIAYNFLISKVNDSPEERTNRLHIKTVFAGIVVIFIPTIINIILTMFKEISNMIFSITNSSSMGDMMLTNIIAITSKPNVDTKTVAEMSSDLIESYTNSSFVFDPTLRVDDIIQYPINWFVAGIISLIFFYILFKIGKKIGDKCIEAGELYIYMPISTLSFTKEGGVMFTRTIFGIISAFVALLLVESLFTILSIVMTTVKEQYGSFMAFIILFIFLIYAVKPRSKISEILEADGTLSSSGTMRQAMTRGAMNGAGTTISRSVSMIGSGGKRAFNGASSLGKGGVNVAGQKFNNMKNNFGSGVKSNSNSTTKQLNLESSTHGQLLLNGGVSNSFSSSSRFGESGGSSKIFNTPPIKSSYLQENSNINRINEKSNGNRGVKI